MSFLQRFFHNVFRDETPQAGAGGFEQLTDQQLEAHLARDCYGQFRLTDAIRPSFDLQVVPRAGWRRNVYHDHQGGTEVPVLTAALSREHLFDAFLDLLDPLGDSVDVVLETSHHRQGRGHQDLYRERIDLPVLKSVLYDYEELLLNDGCTGIAVLNPHIPLEVQFDEHKLLIVYGLKLEPFEDRLRDYGLQLEPDLKFITEAEHVHSSSEEYHQMFLDLQTRLGLDYEDADHAHGL